MPTEYQKSQKRITELVDVFRRRGFTATASRSSIGFLAICITDERVKHEVSIEDAENLRIANVYYKPGMINASKKLVKGEVIYDFSGL